MPPRIALYVPSLSGGGIADVFTNLARGFLEAGHPVDLVLAHRRGPYLKRVPAGVRIVDLKASHVSLSLRALVRYLRHSRPAALFSAPCNANAVAIVAGKLACTNTHVVPTEHSLMNQTVRRATRAKARAAVTFARWAYGWTDAAVAVSEAAAQSLAACTRLARERITVINNPISVLEEQVGSVHAARRHWPSGEVQPRILAAGRLVKQKDFATLLRAFARLRRQRPAGLVLLGEGEERPALASLARRLGVAADVRMPGFVDDPHTYMRAASAFAVSSRGESFGNVLVEAMACGTPVVSTDCPGGPCEILQGGRLGPLVPVGDDVALARALCAVIDAPTPATDLKARAADFSIDRAVKAYLAFVPV